MPAKTAVVEARVDVRILASIAKFYEKHNAMPGSKSALLSQIAEDFCLVLERQKLIEREPDTEEADQYLTRNFGSMRRSERGERAYMKQVQLEGDLRDEELSDELKKMADQIGEDI